MGYIVSSPQNCTFIKIKESLKYANNQEQPKRILLPNAMWYYG
jgi:hypothetical protein